MTTRGRRRRMILRVAAAVVVAVLGALAGCTSAVSGLPGGAARSIGVASPAPSVTVPTVSGGAGGSGSGTASESGAPAATASGPGPGPSRVPTGGGGSGTSSPTASPLPTALPPVPPGSVAGSAGAGDPYYPTAGNGGYQVDAYDVVLGYDPASGRLAATTTIAAEVTSDEPLGRFDLDLQPKLAVSAVTIDGRTARFEQRQAELVIAPSDPLRPGAAVTIVVRYSGRPGMISGGAAGLGDGGWYRTADGGALAAGEPFSASAWYPVNETPSDPATFSVTATVPDGWQVVSNGIKVDGPAAAPAGTHTVRFVEKRPIASYLTTILIDKLTFSTGTFDGRPILNAFTAAAGRNKALAEGTATVLRVLSKHFGPFPFGSYGGIYTGENLPFALETATRPVYASWVDLDTVVHETAHQWFGDDVLIKRWSDICLNECFASYAPWLYRADVDGADLDAKWRSTMATVAAKRSFWAVPLVDMGPGKEFTSVYDRGPLAIHALRHEMGEQAFARLLTGWISMYGGRNASFDDLEAYASTLAGKDLKPFMDAWFRGTVVPPEPYRTPPGLA